MFDLDDVKKFLKNCRVFLIIWCVVGVVFYFPVLLEIELGYAGTFFYGNTIVTLLIIQAFKKKE